MQPAPGGPNAVAYIVFLTLLAGVGGAALAPRFVERGMSMMRTNTVPVPLSKQENRTLASTPAPGARRSLQSKALPAMVYLDVPFSPQAPLGNWFPPFQDACEETSVLMSIAWVRGKAAILPADAEREILEQIAYENYYFGYHRDTALRETLKLLTRHYGYPHARLRYDITLDDIKRELAQGNVVIVPASGTVLNNPSYVNPPLYHMLVVRGYDDIAQEFIVNDPGTKFGAGYRYPYATLWTAIHDWTGSPASVRTGRKGMIVVSPPPQAS